LVANLLRFSDSPELVLQADRLSFVALSPALWRTGYKAERSGFVKRPSTYIWKR
jgi:hypothetical protein